MPNFLENLGLDSFMESEDAIRGLLGYIANKGEAFQGYTKDITRSFCRPAASTFLFG